MNLWLPFLGVKLGRRLDKCMSDLEHHLPSLPAGLAPSSLPPDGPCPTLPLYLAAGPVMPGTLGRKGFSHILKRPCQGRRWWQVTLPRSNCGSRKKVQFCTNESKSYCMSIPRPRLPSGSVVKNLPANAGDARDTGSIPRSGRSPGG